MKNSLTKILHPLLFGALLLPSHLKAEAKKTITLGQSACLDGSLGLYGNIIQKAILARINRINDHGGIKGNTIKLVSLNDSGDPRKTDENIHRMIKDGIDMFIGNTGTRSILKVLPLIKSEKIAMFFPWGGDEALRAPDLTHIINGPGLLQPQLETIVEYIKKNVKLDKIAIFHADDNFSTDGAKDLIAKLNEQKIKPLAVCSYNRFTLDITTPANNLLAQDPKIVICIATSMPTVKLIDHFFVSGHYGTIFFGIDSTLFTSTLSSERNAEFYFSSAIPNPKTSDSQLAQQYQEDLAAYFPNEQPNVLSFTYYFCTTILINALQNIEGTITKEKVIKNIEEMQSVNINGIPLSFDLTNRHAFGKNISIIKG